MGAIEVLPGRSDWSDVPVLMDACERVWIGKTGPAVCLRPVQADDVDLARHFVDSLSKRTSYMRLMSTRRPSPGELQRWTNLDRRYQGAVLATVPLDGGVQQIGVARYAIEPGEEEAEFAIVISDQWQGMGLGMALLAELVELARYSGVKRMFGTTFSDNRAMVVLAQRLGFSVAMEPGAAAFTRMTLDIGAHD